MKLLFRALVKYICGVAFTALLLFLPAGTLYWFNGWLFMGVLFLPMLLIGIILMLRQPELLRKRLEAKETQREQSIVVRLSGLMFLAGFVVAGLDHRFSWSALPDWISIAATFLLLLAYGLYCEVMRQNAFLSRTIQVQENQKVVDTGLYGIVRHPMYTSTLLLFLSIPLILGSGFSFFIFLLYPSILYKRIQNEEQVLKAELQGYTAYCKKVRYRLLSLIW